MLSHGRAAGKAGRPIEWYAYGRGTSVAERHDAHQRRLPPRTVGEDMKSPATVMMTEPLW